MFLSAAHFAFETRWPVLVWTEALYALVYPVFTAALIDPAVTDQKQALGEILSRGLSAAHRLESAALL